MRRKNKLSHCRWESVAKLLPQLRREDGRGGEVEKTELKPSPFCGGYVHLDEAYSYFRDFVLYCEGCDMVFTLDSICITKDELIEAWNQRAQLENKENAE